MRVRTGFWRDSTGSVAIMVALLLPALIGCVALVAEFGRAIVTKTEHQRVADIAAYAGAVAYSAAESTSDMQAAVARMATLNGLSAGNLTPSLITSPRNNGTQAVRVLVSTNQNLYLAPVVANMTNVGIASDAAAEVATVDSPACVIALDPAQSGVTLSGGTRIEADECGVASNSTVTVPCGTEITTAALNYNSSTAPYDPCGKITSPTGGSPIVKKKATVDPLAANAGVTSATSRLSTVEAMTAPTIPAVTTPNGPDLTFPWSETTAFKNTVAGAGCTATYSSGWIISCPAGGTYNFGSATIQNGIKFEATGGNGSGTATYNFKGTVKVDNGTFTFGAGTYNLAKNLIQNGSSVTFGAGTYTITQGLYTGGGSQTTFGAGTFNIGAGTAACGSSKHSICSEGNTLTFGGPSNFVLPSGIYNKGGSTLTLGSGTTNTFDIGPSNAGNALQLGGGSVTTFADALGSTVKFGGTINGDNAGGACLTLPAAPQHDIKGNITTAGGNKFGAGIYTVTGYVAFGATGGGGNVNCNSISVGVDATNVTFVIGGADTISSGQCQGQAFCIGSGYSSVVITAPNSGTTEKIAIIGPTTGSAGAMMTQGATHTQVSGAFYFPVGPITMSGGAKIGDGAGECLQLIGATINMSGGTRATSACIANTATNGGVVTLVD
jgi:Flp pilus assembly protein TadG